jgi:hypothetical protein
MTNQQRYRGLYVAIPVETYKLIAQIAKVQGRRVPDVAADAIAFGIPAILTATAGAVEDSDPE